MGIAIGNSVESLQAQSRFVANHRETPAIRDASDAVELNTIADLALNNSADILARIRELSIAAGSGRLDVTERGDIQNEIAALNAELDRMAHLAGARSRLIDAGVATESSHLTRDQILGNAPASVLVQANQHRQAALRMLA